MKYLGLIVYDFQHNKRCLKLASYRKSDVINVKLTARSHTPLVINLIMHKLLFIFIACTVGVFYLFYLFLVAREANSRNRSWLWRTRESQEAVPNAHPADCTIFFPQSSPFFQNKRCRLQKMLDARPKNMLVFFTCFCFYWAARQAQS